ncbi:MAG: hypothetical protein M1818_000317 [Claussenomyces sp. TS43310]|nr:MAG: hypothetical protein M1818_000317 [Claussenomyces sp. TS43310]
MFSPVYRPRLGPHYVCLPCLCRIFIQSDSIIRKSSRYQSSLLTGPTGRSKPDSDDDGSISTTGDTRNVNGTNEFDTAKSRTDNVLQGVETVHSSDKRAMKALRAALKAEDHVKDKASANQSSKLKRSISEEFPPSDAEVDVDKSIGTGNDIAEKAKNRGQASTDSETAIGKSNAKLQSLRPRGASTRKKSSFHRGSRKVALKTSVPAGKKETRKSSTKKDDGAKDVAKNTSVTIRYEKSTDRSPASKTVPVAAPVPSVSEDLVHKLRQIAQDRGKMMTKKTLVDLLRSGALTNAGKKLAMRKLRQSLITKLNPDIEHIIEQASSRGPIFEAQNATSKSPSYGTVKDAMLSKISPRGSKADHPRESAEEPVKAIEPLREKPSFKNYEIKSVDAADLKLTPYEIAQPPVPTLAYGLERALFNPGVYHLRDPRSRVFNFDPYLQTIMPVAEFDFNALKEYITSSRDEALIGAAMAMKKKYTGSTSSMTSALAHFHYLLSHWRDINVSNLSKGFPDDLLTFTAVQRSPAAIFLRWKDGTYAIDADKQYDTPNVLSMLGKSMEKLLTLPTEDYERYRKENSHQISEEEREEVESYHYTTMGDFLMRSQLDAYDPRLPGTGMFDLKTRAVVAIRMDAQNYQQGVGYEILGRHGEYHSFEREYYDMIRSAFLKYSLQVRMGRMDGIFVAFHNTERIFGFQYISLNEMDLALHGTEDTTIGDSEFKLSLELLNRILDRATAKYPRQSLHLHFEARQSEASPFLYIFATPVTDEEIQKIQNTNKAEIEKFEKRVLGLSADKTAEEMLQEEVEAENEEAKAGWEALQAEVEEEIENDEIVSLEKPGDAAEDKAISDDEEEEKMHPTTEDVDQDTEKRLDELLSAVNSHESTIASTDQGTLRDAAQNVEHGTVSIREDFSSNSDKNQNNDEQLLHVPADSAESEIAPRSEGDNPTLNSEQTTEHEEQTEGRIAESSKPEDQPRESLLAMYLTVRNKVNGKYVQRPEKLSRNDKWTVEYALAEIPHPKNRTLYNATLTRRKHVLMSGKADKLSNFQKVYLAKIGKLVEESKEFRQQQDELDQVEPLKVFAVDEKGQRKESE